MKAKIIGAGSIGNHLSKACRDAGFEVTVVDRDAAALKRMKEDIYPKRYGAWDESIKLFTAAEEPKGGFDAILIGTPPDSHMPLALAALKEKPKVIQIEKPLCTPDLNGLDQFMKELKKNPATGVIVGFNHILAQNTVLVEKLMQERAGVLGALRTIDCEIRSHWENIFKAHPWLKGPQDTYLGFWKRGGGAGGEHIHAVNLWQHFAHAAGMGRVTEVQALIEYVEKDGASYDSQIFIQVLTEKNLPGRICQDVITQPKRKWANLQFDNGALQWHNDVSKTTDEVKFIPKNGEPETNVIEKTRLEEFAAEAQHIAALVNGSVKIAQSPIRLERAAESALVLQATHQSAREKKIIKVDYSLLA